MTDFYQFTTYDNLAPEDYRTLFQVREFMAQKVAPIINKHWLEDTFPMELLPKFKKIGQYICNQSALLTGLIVQEMGRIDPSIATFYNIQNGLVIGSILKCGTEEQKKKWISRLSSFEKIGCFALTEPESGSDAAKGLQTTCRGDGERWAINGQKKWVGNSTWCDISIVWARDIEDDSVKGFIVENGKPPEFCVTKIKDKFGLKVCQNGLIDIHQIVPEENRLEGSFKDVLKYTRYLVACEATGCQMGAYEHALKYAKERKQFGKPIGANQLIQDLLAKMLANITACQCMCNRLGKLIDKGNYTVAQSSLCKAFCTLRMRETVAWAREIFGANGLSIEYNVGRFFADAEAIYTYEGSYQMNNLMIGKAITGESAFV